MLEVAMLATNPNNRGVGTFDSSNWSQILIHGNTFRSLNCIREKVNLKSK